MNKKFLTLIFMFVIMCFISVVDVRATTCTYGIKNGDDWEAFIQIYYESSDGVIINTDATASPFIKNITTDGGWFEATPAGESVLQYNTGLNEGTNSPTWDPEGDRFYIYAKLFATPDDYDENNGACPATLIYETIMMEGSYYYYYHLKIAPDDMQLDAITIKEHGLTNSDSAGDDDKAAEEFGLPSESGVLVEQYYSDRNLNEIENVYGCQTYSTYYQAMVKAVENDEDKSCDNNVEFNEKYQKIQNLCAAYRSTSEYYDPEATNSNNGEKGNVNSCQRACSILKDDVAALCGIIPDGGQCGLGYRVLNWIFKIFGIVRYAVPAILIILSVLDYIKAIAADNEDEMKKVSGRFFKRLIAAALIFLLPLVLDFILKLFDIPGLTTENPFCAE